MSITTVRPFPAELRRLQDEIEAIARRSRLDFFETVFEVLNYEELNEVAAFGGFPTRYAHWRFGMAYEELAKGYTYGLQKIYEMVINNDPCYAYLLECNTLMDQKLVMAHVYGHCDFFKNNIWFAHTNRKMMDQMANHGNCIRAYMDKHGVDEVESFIDACLSIEDLIDIHSPGIKRRERASRYDFGEPAERDPIQPGKFKSKPYMDGFVNPRQRLEDERKQLEDQQKQAERRFPEHPERDVMLFLIENAPLANWQRDVLSIVRDEAYYFAPQAQTKIMNEGWASYWHSTIMTQHELTTAEVVDYADHHSGTVATHPGRVNPYKLGLELFRNIEERWNTGRFGRAYEECDDRDERAGWDKDLGLGRAKIFEVRKIYNDVTFIDDFLTPEFCREQQMFAYAFNDKTHQYEIESREFKKIKERLLFSLTNFGQPFIAVQDANHENRSELYLLHQHNGVDLKLDYAEDTLRNIHKLWTRPVHLETRFDDKPVVLTFDGTEQHKRLLGDNS
jgi:stage V sporulation protein R